MQLDNFQPHGEDGIYGARTVGAGLQWYRHLERWDEDQAWKEEHQRDPHQKIPMTTVCIPALKYASDVPCPVSMGTFLEEENRQIRPLEDDDLPDSCCSRVVGGRSSTSL